MNPHLSLPFLRTALHKWAHAYTFNPSTKKTKAGGPNWELTDHSSNTSLINKENKTKQYAQYKKQTQQQLK